MNEPVPQDRAIVHAEKGNSVPQDESEQPSFSSRNVGPQDGSNKQDIPPFGISHLDSSNPKTPNYGYVSELKRYLTAAGYQLEAIDLSKKYQDLLLANKDFEEKIPPLNNEIETHQKQLEKERTALEEFKKSFSQHFSDSGLPFPTNSFGEKRPVVQSRVRDNPKLMTAYIVNTVLNDPHLTFGRLGIEPIENSKKSLINRFGQFLLDSFAPLAAGALLGLNITVLLGVLDVNSIYAGDRLSLLVLAVLIGFATEKLAGYFNQALTSSWARHLEDTTTSGAASTSVRHKKSLFTLFILGILSLLLSAAVVTVDTYGIRELHEQANSYDEREGDLLPLFVYFIIGVIVSLPYLAYKAMRGWKIAEENLRESRAKLLCYEQMRGTTIKEKVNRSYEYACMIENQSVKIAEVSDLIRSLEEKRHAEEAKWLNAGKEFAVFWNNLVDRQVALRDSKATFNSRQYSPFQPLTWIKGLRRLKWRANETP